MILSLIGVTFILFVVLVITMTYVKWGFKVLTAKLRWKSSASFMLIRGRSNNFNLPFVFNNDTDQYKIKLGNDVLTFPINRQEKAPLTLLGMPLYIRDINDCSNDLGLIYYDPQNPDTYSIKKAPGYIAPEEQEIILNNYKLSSNFKSFMDKYQTLLYIVIGLLIATAFNLYVSWEVLQFINDWAVAV